MMMEVKEVEELEEGEIPQTASDKELELQTITSAEREDDGFEDEGNIYSRLASFVPTFQGLQRKSSRGKLAKKQRSLVEAGKGSVKDYYDVYGPDARAEVIINPPDNPNAKLHIDDLSGLVAWIYGEGEMPKWIFVRNKPLVSKVVMLFVPGIDAALFMARPDLFQNITACCGLPRPHSALSTTADSMSTARLLLSLPSSKKRRQPGEGGRATAERRQAKVPRRFGMAGVVNAVRRLAHSEPAAPAPGSPDRLDPGRYDCSSDDGGEGPCDRNRKGGSSKKKTDNEEEEEEVFEAGPRPPFPPMYYVLTPAQLRENNYPTAKPSVDGDLIIPPPGFAMTKPCAPGESFHEMLAVDCEMCYTAKGLELTRVTVVNVKGKVVYDKLVLPENPITDYNTQFSGITAFMMKGVTTSIHDAQREIVEIVKAETILVGHSLESDLGALRLVHARCVDTAVLFPHPRGPPFKPALRVLAKRFLKRTIQQADSGHDSAEDARAALDLVLLKIRNGPSFGNQQPGGGNRESLLAMLSQKGQRASIIDRRHMVHEFASATSSALVCSSDEDVVEKACREMSNNAVSFVWARLAEVSACLDEAAKKLDNVAARAAEVAAMMTCSAAREGGEGAEAAVPPLWERLEVALAKMDSRVQRLHAALPTNAVLMLVTGHGDTAFVRRYQELKWKRQASVAPGLGEWEQSNEDVMAECCARAKTALAFVTVKT